jgi:hypothetical protein
MIMEQEMLSLELWRLTLELCDFLRIYGGTPCGNEENTWLSIDLTK